ncbi:MAG TPA: endonuclease/exonuclease/phosphatase family protein [Rubricoccaceae bacterium]
MRLSTPRAALAALALTALVGGCDSGEPETAEVRVMSQNLYLGADLNTVAGESNPQMIPVRVAQFYAAVEATNPAERMEAIAAEIARVRPALVGLQEVTTYYVQSPADNLPGGASTPATTVTYDFLDLLLDALSAEGETYRVVSRSDNSDVEFPGTTNGTSFFDVRYRDADVILARSDVSTSGAVDGQFTTLLTVPVGGVNQTFVRGYQSVRATVDGLSFTFFNTHLETEAAAPIQIAQGTQLNTLVAATTGPVVLVGDLNSDAGGTTTSTYATITGALTDAIGSGAGTPTCCQSPAVVNTTSEHDTRIDLILFRGFESVGETETLFDAATDRTATGRWPSDHAGVWAELVAELD